MLPGLLPAVPDEAAGRLDPLAALALLQRAQAVHEAAVAHSDPLAALLGFGRGRRGNEGGSDGSGRGHCHDELVHGMLSIIRVQFAFPVRFCRHRWR